MVQTPWRTCRRGRTCRTGSRRSSSSTAGAHTLTRTDVRQPYAVRSLRGSRIVPLVQPPPHALPLSSHGAEVRDTGWLCSHHIPPGCQTQNNLRQGPVMQEEIPFTPSLHLHRLVDRQIGRFVEPLIERWSVLTAPVTRAMLRRSALIMASATPAPCGRGHSTSAPEARGVRGHWRHATWPYVADTVIEAPRSMPWRTQDPSPPPW